MNRRRVFLVLGCFFLLCAIGCGVYIYSRTLYTPPAQSQALAPVASAVPTQAPTPTPSPGPTATAAPTAVPSPTPEPYISPVDFEALRAVNGDIYAWLQVEGTPVDYPVVQHGSDDDFYLTHDSDGNYSANGAIFSQKTYNGTDFSDPVTVLYGHRMASGTMFGALRDDFSDPAFFAEHRSITVYTPEKERNYRIFAAVPYSNEHILYAHDFADEEDFDAFFDGIYAITDADAQLDRDARPAFGDRIIILSTCLKVDRTRRYLVMGALLP